MSDEPDPISPKLSPLVRSSPVTAYDVAHRAGVSQSAVSRTFTPGASVSEKTRQKVVKAAAELNYRPNLIARSLSTRRSNMIGIIVPPLENQFYPEMLETLAGAFGQYGQRILLFTSRHDASNDPILQDVLNARVDALVMVSASVSSVFADECRAIGLPIVMLNRKTDSRSVSSVTGANRKGAAAIADFLVAGRHTRFAYLAGLETSSTSRDREEAFVERLAHHGKELACREIGNYSTAGATAAARALLGRDRPPDAIFCANDHMALVTIGLARSEFGLDVGRAVSVVGFDDSQLARWPLFLLTTYSQPLATMADKVAEIVDEQLNGEGGSVAEIEVPGELLVRQSARLPRRGLSGPPERMIWRAPKNG